MQSVGLLGFVVRLDSPSNPSESSEAYLDDGGIRSKSRREVMIVV